MEKKIRKNQFDFNDFYNQIQQIKKMGNVKDLAAMIPGVGKAIRDVDIPEDAFKSIEAIIQSMTQGAYQSCNPQYLSSSAYCKGFGYQYPGSEQTYQAVWPDSQDDADDDGQQDGSDDEPYEGYARYA